MNTLTVNAIGKTYRCNFDNLEWAVIRFVKAGYKPEEANESLVDCYLCRNQYGEYEMFSVKGVHECVEDEFWVEI